MKMKINDKVEFIVGNTIKGMTGVIEEINGEEYVVRVDNSPLIIKQVSARAEHIKKIK